MANKMPRNPGEFLSTSIEGRVSAAPDAVVGFGTETASALQRVGSQLSARIGQMADKAASREGEAAGMEAGAAAGEKFIEKSAADARAEAKGAGKGTAPQKVAVAAEGASGLDDRPLQLRRNGTIRGDAFDAAAATAYGWRMQSGLAADLAAAYEGNQDSPGGYAAAVESVRSKYAEEPLLISGPLKETFEKLFHEKTSIGTLSVRSRYEAKLKAEARAAAVEGLETMRQSLERDAYNLGGNPAGDEVLTQQMARLDAQIDGLVGSGTYSAREGAKVKKALGNTVMAARLRGTFDNLENPERQADFALSIMDDWSSGAEPFAGMSLDEARGLSNELYSAAVRNQTAITSETRKARSGLEALIEDDLASIATTGQGVDDETLSPDRVESLLGTGARELWQKQQDLAQRGWQATAGMELETPQELAARLEALRPAPGSPDFETQLKIHDAAAKKATAVLAERETDPLGQASRAGLIELTPIDTSSAEALSSSLGQRRDAAEAVAREYGVAPVVFRPEERKGLADAFNQFPDMLPGFASTVVAQLGELAPVALSELSEAGPELAHVAGIAAVTGDSSVAMDIADVLKARAEKRSIKLPSGGTLADAAGTITGPAFSAAPALRSAVLGTANMLLEHEAMRLGFDPSDVAKPGTQAHETYARVIDQALGARMINGTKWGGLAEVNGRPVVAPSFMPAGEIGTVLGALRDEDLAALPPIDTGNEVLVTAGQIRGGQLVAVGDGQYRVALGDPESFDPQWLVGANGDYWVLDLDRLREVHADRIAATRDRLLDSRPVR